MVKTVFAKVFIILLTILIISFTVTGILLSVGLHRMVAEQRAEQLITAGEKIEEGLELYLTGLIGLNDSRLFLSFIKAISENTESMIWIVRNDGAVIMYSDMPEWAYDELEMTNDGWIKLPDKRQYEHSASAKDSEYQSGDFYGLFKMTGVEWITVKNPFRIQNVPPHNTKAEGIILVHSEMPLINNTKYSVIGIFLISGGIGSIIALVLTFILSRRLVRPLKEMKSAAKRIASGKFEERIVIKGEDEISELSKSFNNMVDALKNLETMRRDFISNVSHELRTPITTIKGFIEGILDGVIPEDKHENYLMIVRDEVKRMQGLVNDLLDLAKMQAGESTMRMTVFDINELIRRCVISLQQMFIEKDLEFEGDFETERIYVNADYDAINRVIINLLHNAIKFTSPSGKIFIRTMKKNGVTVTVEDTGQGIPSGELPYIFDRFYKTDKSRSKDKTGVGLGLAIVKNIISAHKEEITVESEEGHGTRFIFTLRSANDPEK